MFRVKINIYPWEELCLQANRAAQKIEQKNNKPSPQKNPTKMEEGQKENSQHGRLGEV